MRTVKTLYIYCSRAAPFTAVLFTAAALSLKATAADQIPLPRLASRRFLSPTPPQVPQLHPSQLVAQHPCRRTRTCRRFRPPPPHLLLTVSTLLPLLSFPMGS